MSNPNWFQPHIFDRFPEVTAVHSLRDPSQPGEFSMLYAAPTEVLAQNRAALLEAAGLRNGKLAIPKLQHGDRILELSEDFSLAQRPEADALMTDKPGWLTGVAVADCVAVLLYDPAHHAIAAVHSGWRGSALNITAKAVGAMQTHYHTQPEELYAYVSPAPAREEYEVDHETVSVKFDQKYSSSKAGGKDWFDNKAVVYDQLVATGVAADHIELDPRSNLTDPRFHSYRRDGDKSGRMIVAIGLR